MSCRYPFAHDPHSCDCTPSKLSRDIDRWNANAKARAEMARAGRLTLLAVWVVCFAALAGAVAVGPMRAEAQFQSDMRR